MKIVGIISNRNDAIEIQNIAKISILSHHFRHLPIEKKQKKN